MNFYYDTETNGLPSFKLPSEDPSQPRAVQLAMLLEAPGDRVVAAISLLIKPSSWKLPLVWSTEAEQAHGITQEMAETYGVPAQHALALYLDLLGKAKMVIAHNLQFDAKIMRASLHAEGMPVPDRKPEFCTMTQSTKIVNLPPTAKMQAANMHRPKPPTLGEAYQFCTGAELKGAHDGLADAYACRRIFHALISCSLCLGDACSPTCAATGRKAHLMPMVCRASRCVVEIVKLKQSGLDGHRAERWPVIRRLK